MRLCVKKIVLNGSTLIVIIIALLSFLGMDVFVIEWEGRTNLVWTTHSAPVGSLLPNQTCSVENLCFKKKY